jgi:hypothetical protein
LPTRRVEGLGESRLLLEMVAGLRCGRGQRQAEE